METAMSESIMNGVMDAAKTLAETEQDVRLESPFTGFFLTLNVVSGVVAEYPMHELGFADDFRTAYLVCEDLFGAKK